MSTFCCPSMDMLRIAVHCSGLVAGAIGRLQARQVSAPKDLAFGVSDDIAKATRRT